MRHVLRVAPFSRPPVTPSEEHAEARRRLHDLQTATDRIERMARDYRQLDKGIR